jgi:hypothetical protein
LGAITTVYRWLDGSMSVPIVVELLLRLMVGVESGQQR